MLLLFLLLFVFCLLFCLRVPQGKAVVAVVVFLPRGDAFRSCSRKRLNCRSIIQIFYPRTLARASKKQRTWSTTNDEKQGKFEANIQRISSEMTIKFPRLFFVLEIEFIIYFPSEGRRTGGFVHISRKGTLLLRTNYAADKLCAVPVPVVVQQRRRALRLALLAQHTAQLALAASSSSTAVVVEKSWHCTCLFTAVLL